MTTKEQKIEAAVAAGEIPGLILLATDTADKFYYGKAIGNASLKPGAERPMTLDTTLAIASCTKIITTIAVLQCVERGQFGLDDDVSTVLGELHDLKVLKGFEEGTEAPILVPAKNKITLRHLLTHSSGIAYDFADPNMIRWRASTGHTPDIGESTPLLQRATLPLLFEPGEGFVYGYSLDWAGILVARLNNVSLEDYIQKNICEPLAITDLTFHLEKNEEVRAKLADFNFRMGGMTQFATPADPNGQLTWIPGRVWPDPVVEDYGGWGALTSGPSFMKVLVSILRNDGKLLRPGTVEDMFTDQLSTASKEMLNATLSIPEVNNYLGGTPLGLQKTWGLGGLIVLEDHTTGQKAGSLRWAGLPNLFWWIDRKVGLCGLYASQLVPTGDPKSMEWSTVFIQDMYERVERFRAKV
ncbi:beta-lactamase/transpeptidase-like protein [Aspergillus caelatus]|uniref:Beta-lactamase/transpeptidase-like protein n=1 Tax=Aspergillus caelatus TaxID=61420 RepID=A0A5N6ZL96_9EURO|nr:beta-lactamase/transpeptidase-like protein [Aspergillus caelatus]KAE8358391.1 beta-lactamase/transpeptidase-like protein [Aspergillus caelatus]